jgi:Protein of unknown function (DUF2474)
LSAPPPGPLYKRLLWMFAIWSMSVLALGIVALGIKFVIKH